MGGALQMMLVAIGVLIVGGIGTALWTASRDNGLVIEAFSVPPDMAARGMTGQVVAGQLLDKLAAMQDATDSARPAASYSNNWGSDLKIEIPDTGISLGEAWRTLAGWLGHETHITGEVYRTANGLALTARAGGEGSATVSGTDADLDKMLQQVAEDIYHRTQPYRYAAFIEGTAKPDLAGARAILQRLSVEGTTVRERAWATLGVGVNDLFSGNISAQSVQLRQAIALDPDFALAWGDLESGEGTLEHEENSFQAGRKAIRLMANGSGADMTPRAQAITLISVQGDAASDIGDFAAARDYYTADTRLPDYSGTVENSRESAASMLASLHEPGAARRAWSSFPVDATATDQRASTLPTLDFNLSDWQAVLRDRPAAEVALERGFLRDSLAQALWPFVARALAETGDIAGGEALIARTPLDCDLCVRERGRIAALKHDWSGAARWYAMVSARSPSIPFADTLWGQMLMAKGDLDGAIAKFDSAHRKGPHYADPLEMWGEALIAKNRSDLALAKFEEAAHDAPNWGRLHLKWGEALLWSGDKDGAKKQFAIAAGLGLTPAEKSELARMGTPHGR
jgi:tetratricopeptide (TPR) repeat protein